MASPTAHARGKKVSLRFESLPKAHAPEFVRAEQKKLHADASIAWFDLNGDKKKDFCVSYSGGSLGSTGANIQCFIAKAKTKSKFKKVVDVIAAPEVVSLPGTKTKGHWDLIFGGAGFDMHRVYKWNGREYQ